MRCKVAEVQGSKGVEMLFEIYVHGNFHADFADLQELFLELRKTERF
jgi:hypothetical protein